MSLLTLFFTSIGLSMDACAVSICNGMCFGNITRKQIIYTAAAFGFFQAFMPLIGYIIGSTISDEIAFLDHWITLILLGFIGGKMIFEALKELKFPEACLNVERSLTLKTLLLQAIATSIDALAVGIGFALIKVDILSAALSIGIITFINSTIGFNLGRKFGELFKQKTEILGGVILIFIGLKIFIDHTLT